MPPAYLVVERSDPEWLAIREALAAQRIAETHGEAVDQAAAQTISAAKSAAVVQAALLATALHGEAISAAWAAAVQ